ncbi:hypothetical protein DITRI_Ditri12bG0089800 [Diplodiscus trichospermus]
MLLWWWLNKRGNGLWGSGTSGILLEWNVNAIRFYEQMGSIRFCLIGRCVSKLIKMPIFSLLCQFFFPFKEMKGSWVFSCISRWLKMETLAAEVPNIWYFSLCLV